jgi:hypothetical protein
MSPGNVARMEHRGMRGSLAGSANLRCRTRTSSEPRIPLRCIRATCQSRVGCALRTFDPGRLGEWCAVRTLQVGPDPSAFEWANGPDKSEVLP